MKTPSDLRTLFGSSLTIENGEAFCEIARNVDLHQCCPQREHLARHRDRDAKENRADTFRQVPHPRRVMARCRRHPGILSDRAKSPRAYARIVEPTGLLAGS